MSQAQGEVVVEGVVVEQPAEPAAVRATTTAAATPDIAVEEGLELIETDLHNAPQHVVTFTSSYLESCLKTETD